MENFNKKLGKYLKSENLRLYILTLVLLGLGSALVYAGDLQIQADKQSFKMEENKAKFEGNVKVEYEDLKVMGKRAEVNIDPQSKKLKDATFFDQPYVIQVKKGKTNEIKANIIKMSLIGKKVRAEGNTQTTVTENAQPTAIITADAQEYDSNTKVLTANGSVIIYYKDVETFSDKAVANMNKEGDLQKITLTGHGKLKQKDSLIVADQFIYDAITEEAFGIGNAYSDINMDDSRIQVWSSRQQYDKKTNVMMAAGNVHVIYKDYDARGPKASVYPDPKTNKPNKVVFVGRSKINSEGRTIEADRIEMLIEPKNFFAEGNVKTFIPNVQNAQNGDL